MRNLKCLFTALLLLCSLTATANNFEVDGINYNILSENDKTVKVIYKGEFYNEYTGNVVIPECVTYNGTTYTVTSIGFQAFRDCFGLTSITIPNSVTSIGSCAFSGCYGLTGELVIPNSVTSIDVCAFDGCSGLTSIEIPNSVTSIGNSAFSNCSGLTSIEIPNSVTSIGKWAFDRCTGLTSATIGNSVTSIGFRAFWNCTGLTSIEIPNSVTSIGNSAFSNCSGLTSIEIPNSVTSIGKWAFDRCTGLTSATIGNSVTSIESYAFRGCSGLTSITSLIPAENLFAISSVLFANVNKTACTLYVPYGAKETYAATAGWEDFVNIVEMDFTGIEDVVAEGERGKDVYYDLQGRVVENPTNGVYIIDGKKVLVK